MNQTTARWGLSTVVTESTKSSEQRGASTENPGRRSMTRRLVAVAAFSAGLAMAIVTPVAAYAAGHTCSSNNVCYYNSAGFAADPPGGAGVVNPWGAVAGNYLNLNGYASPHTYNNPDVCNNVYAFYPPCNENDTISSVKNTSSSRKLRLYNNASYSGGFQTIWTLSSDNLVTYNDQISSFCWNDGSAGVSACSF